MIIDVRQFHKGLGSNAGNNKNIKKNKKNKNPLTKHGSYYQWVNHEKGTEQNNVSQFLKQINVIRTHSVTFSIHRQTNTSHRVSLNSQTPQLNQSTHTLHFTRQVQSLHAMIESN